MYIQCIQKILINTGASHWHQSKYRGTAEKFRRTKNKPWKFSANFRQESSVDHCVVLLTRYDAHVTEHCKQRRRRRRRRRPCSNAVGSVLRLLRWRAHRRCCIYRIQDQRPRTLRRNIYLYIMAKSANSFSSYKLSHELVGHTDEVQSLAIFKNGSFVSTSKDNTARFWKPKEEGVYEESILMKGHTGFVCSACIIEPTAKNPTGFIVTGSSDKNICIYYPGEENPVHTIQAHESIVNGLNASILEKDSFFTCSSDHTGKLWNLYDLTKPEATFLGHAQTAIIWCIADLPNGSVVTGGSDKIAIVYLRSGTILHRLIGHKGCIRDIAVVNVNEFLTCGTDAVTKHWHAISGVCLGTYGGHTNHIYSISALFEGTLAVSCGDDRTVRVWRNGRVQQTIGIPSETVRSVRLLPNKDLICGSSDGVVRIFTVNPQRFIDRESMIKFKEAVIKSIEKYAKESKPKDVGNVEDIPLTSELHQPGEKDGDTIIVRNGDKVKAYRWHQEQFEWKLIGDVVENETRTKGKPTLNGVQYDYVFSVDIEEGKPFLKLPYNKGQDPYLAAQKFLEDNDLDQTYLDRIANFITTNLQLTPILNAEAQYSNPFAEGGRYVSNSPENNDQAGASRSSPPSTLGQINYIPQRQYLKLEQANISAIYEKLKEFNSKNEDGIQRIEPEKLESLVNLVTAENEKPIDEEMNVLKALLNWPDNVVFPVLDIARLAVLRAGVNEQFCSNGILDVLKRHVQNDAVTSNQMLTFRLLANLFSHETGEQFCIRSKNEVLTAVRDLNTLGNKSNEIAISTYILNLVIALNKTNDTFGKMQVLGVIFRLLEILKDTEALFRVFVALGSLILDASSATERKGFVKSVKQSRPVLKALRILLDGVDSSNVPNKLLSLTRQILELIKT
ncbi:phospholipase A-2-activating protein isoform X3 [Nasonia vitripennis]|uniref:Phospholipase A-2-activating protein n=1 Tax=Nasonia vitripennis TaxID=7425 RepID=A0A7M7G859_NASVI|nr:phospholipase A-2-activating protein isoform X3 [Nasonia vitripennis]